MPLTLEWHDIALRLALTMLAGVLLGLNRTERGRSAGLRTTLLVSLAASVAMIQTNLLMPTTGKTPATFAVLDLMRLPLGILTGMGFIGGGAILRQGNRVQGVTTAATLWFATVIGLCFGGGQHGLGLAGLALGALVLWLLRWVESRISQERRARLTLRAAADGPTEGEVRLMLHSAGYQTVAWNVAFAGNRDKRLRTLRCEVRWHGRDAEVESPSFLSELARRPGVLKLQWKL